MTNTDKLNMNIVHISDVLDWKKDVEPYAISLWKGGCGSGKNAVIDKIIRQEFPGAPRVRVAMITSRASKRKEVIEGNSDYAGYIGLENNIFLTKEEYFYFMAYNLVPQQYEKYYDEQTGDLVKDACVIPIQVESLMLDAAFSDYDDLFGLVDIFWNKFDLIVVDEVHSLLLDSSFMTSQARVGELIKAFARRCNNSEKHMILMTATNECVMPYLRKNIPGLHRIDFTKKTFSVMPKQVRITPIDQVKRELELLYQNNIKFIYFYNGRTVTLSKFCKESIMSEEDGVSLFSNLDERKALSKSNPEEYKKMLEVEDCLAKTGYFPDWVKFVISTSRNREGISIRNEDFKYMYVDSHIPPEVIQYAGRLRNAEYTLTIVDGAYQYWNGSYEENKRKQEADRQYVDELNEKFMNLNDEQLRRMLIERIESEKKVVNGVVTDNADYRPYIFFNPFTFRFEFNELKVAGEEYISWQIYNWKHVNRKQKNSFSNFVKKWFPNVKVEPYETREYQSLMILKKHRVFPNSEKRGENNTYYTDATIESLKADFLPLWGKFEKINTYLRRFDKELSFRKIKQGKNKGKWELIRKPNESLNN